MLAVQPGDYIDRHRWIYWILERHASCLGISFVYEQARPVRGRHGQQAHGLALVQGDAEGHALQANERQLGYGQVRAAVFKLNTLSKKVYRRCK